MAGYYKLSNDIPQNKFDNSDAVLQPFVADIGKLMSSSRVLEPTDNSRPGSLQSKPRPHFLADNGVAGDCDKTILRRIERIC